MARVVVSTQAISDAVDIIRNLDSKTGLQVAAKFEIDFEELFDRLAIFPEIGAPRPELGRAIRIGLVPPYVAIYRYTPAAKNIEIVRILHGSRRISRRLLRAK